MGTVVLKDLHKDEMSEALEKFLACLFALSYLSKLHYHGAIGIMIFGVFIQMSTKRILKNRRLEV